MNLNSSSQRIPFGNKTNSYSSAEPKRATDLVFSNRKTNQENKPFRSRPRKFSDSSKHTTLVESSACKQHVKEFLNELKPLEEKGFRAVLEGVHQKIGKVPSEYHWKVFLEVAELAKRHGKGEAARELLEKVRLLQPHAQQAWLEQSKLEEESGALAQARDLLLQGLRHCPYSDQLSIKYIKLQEKLQDLTPARRVLGSAWTYSEKNWKILVEGALMEARAGNFEKARNDFQTLMANCSAYGAVFLEAVKFEEKWGCLGEAMKNCEKGLEMNPRYGPLWFAYLRILDKLEYQINLGKVKEFKTLEIIQKKQDLVSRGKDMLTKELIWKLYIDYALSLERKGNLEKTRQFLKEAVLTCPNNLRWKAFMIGARVEVRAGNHQVAVKLLREALEEVPAKQKASVLVELGKAYELAGELQQAETTMVKACEFAFQDWKIHLERITFHMRVSEFEKALEITKEAIVKFSSTGRLWAALIQLKHTSKQYIAEEMHFKAFALALMEVPKSGEVWCEGARLRMNPFTPFYDLNKAEIYLNFAIQFTPQYGDSFIELLRLYIIRKEYTKIKELKRLCINADPNYGMLWFYCKQSGLESAAEVWKNAKAHVITELCCIKTLYESPLNSKHIWQDHMWSAIAHLNWSLKNHTQIDPATKYKLVFGSETIKCDI